jgi:hypothetical protein
MQILALVMFAIGAIGLGIASLLTALLFRDQTQVLCFIT